jgi:hypothetical protein
MRPAQASKSVSRRGFTRRLQSTVTGSSAPTGTGWRVGVGRASPWTLGHQLSVMPKTAGDYLARSRRTRRRRDSAQQPRSNAAPRTRTNHHAPALLLWCNALLREGLWWASWRGSLDGMQEVRQSVGAGNLPATAPRAASRSTSRPSGLGRFPAVTWLGRRQRHGVHGRGDVLTAEATEWRSWTVIAPDHDLKAGQRRRLRPSAAAELRP